MPKPLRLWEYRVEKNLKEPDDLNAFGLDGWELVSVAESTGGYSWAWYYYFKRELERF